MDTSGLVGELQLLNFRQNIFLYRIMRKSGVGNGERYPLPRAS